MSILHFHRILPLSSTWDLARPYSYIPKVEPKRLKIRRKIIEGLCLFLIKQSTLSSVLCSLLLNSLSTSSLSLSGLTFFLVPLNGSILYYILFILNTLPHYLIHTWRNIVVHSKSTMTFYMNWIEKIFYTITQMPTSLICIWPWKCLHGSLKKNTNLWFGTDRILFHYYFIILHQQTLTTTIKMLHTRIPDSTAPVSYTHLTLPTKA